ncbi:MAG TPA: hypothetical protein VHN99_05950 [Deinococcales bacterium]|nr:hypothetical protein [Deinococcales bacterium]
MLRVTPVKAFATMLVMLAGITVLAQQAQPAPKPAPPQIPGITATDSHPNGCVNCHQYRADLKRDYRLSTTLHEWSQKGTEADFVNIAKAVWPNAKITGRHPDVTADLKGQDIPGACIDCHEGNDIPLERVLHLVHLSLLPDGPAANPGAFITAYGGFCTNCHTVGASTGLVTVKSGKENEPPAQ